MATAVIVIILIIIGIFSVKSYFKKVTRGCCGGEIDESNQKIKPHDPKKENYPYCLTMEIKGMTCSNCQRRVENVFNQIDGYYMEVDLGNHRATLLSKQPVANETVSNLVKSAGYRAVKIKEVFK